MVRARLRWAVVPFGLASRLLGRCLPVVGHPVSAIVGVVVAFGMVEHIRVVEPMLAAKQAFPVVVASWTCPLASLVVRVAYRLEFAGGFQLRRQVVVPHRWARLTSSLLNLLSAV